MALVLVVLVLSALVGFALGGRPGAMVRVPLRGWPLLFAAALCQLGGSLATRVTGAESPYEVGSIAAVLLLGAFLLRNTRLPGVALVAAGLLLNAVVVAANGAMPVSRWAAARAGVGLSRVAAGLDGRHQVAGAGTAVRRLGDVVPLPLPWVPEVVSPGDVLVAAGLGLLLAAALLWGQAGRERRPPGSAATGTPADAIRDTTRASASTTRGSYS